MEGQAVVLARFRQLRKDADGDRRFVREQIDDDRAEPLHGETRRRAGEAADVRGGRDRRDRERGRARVYFAAGARRENLRGDRGDGGIPIVQRVAQEAIGARVLHLADARQQGHARIAHRHAAVGRQPGERADQARQAILEIGCRLQAFRAGKDKARVITAQCADSVVDGRQRVDRDIRIRILRESRECGTVFHDACSVGGVGAHLPDRVGHHRLQCALCRCWVDGSECGQCMRADPPVATTRHQRWQR